MPKKAEIGVVILAVIVFAGLLVKEWIGVRTANLGAAKKGNQRPAEAKSVLPPAKKKTTPVFNLDRILGLSPFYAQRQVLYRFAAGDLYIRDPDMIDKLDLDDGYEMNEYRFKTTLLATKAEALHIDLNTVFVKPNPNHVRFLALPYNEPVRFWRLFLLTGNDTAQLLEDGIHLRRNGFPEEVISINQDSGDERLHSEMGVILWRNGRTVEPGTKALIRQISLATIDEIRKHENRGPLYRVNCDALRKFVQPLSAGESSREMVLKIDVPVSPEERKDFPHIGGCPVDIASRDDYVRDDYVR